MVLPAKCTEANANRRAAIAGAIFGFGLITKITFAPLAAVVLLLPEKSRKRRFVVAAALASLLLLLPVIPRIPAMASWFTSLLVHTGTYGGGRIGIPQKSELAANFLVLLRDEPPLFWFLSLYLGVLLLPGIRDMARPLLLTAFLAIGAEILMVVKHPGTHYLVPVLVLTAFVNSALCVMLLRAEPRNSAWRQFYLALIVASIGVGLVHNWGSLRWWMDAARMDRRNISEMQTLETKLIGCQIIGSYRSSLELYALAFASDYSGGVHRNTLEKLYPGTIHYDPFGGRFLSFAFAEKSEEIERLVLSGQCVLIESTPLDADALDRFRVKNHIHLATLTIAANPVSPTEPTALYRLDLTGSR